MSVHALGQGDDLTSHPIILEAAALLRAGGMVAFPTETVYGLGVDARSEAAVERLLEAKQRPPDNPLIVHLSSAEDLILVAARVPAAARALAGAFWPGPLTLVLPARPELVRAACRGLPTVGVRVPDHPVALALLRAAGIPVAAPSANLSGRPSPTRASDVERDLGAIVPIILDGGPCRVGIESTVLDLSGDAPLLLRPGTVTSEQLSSVLGVPVAEAAAPDALRRSPGMRHRHYAPRARLVLVGPGVSPQAAVALARRLGRTRYAGTRPELLAHHGLPPRPPADVARIARSLHALLRDLDEPGVDAILADTVEEHGIGRAVMDRLRRGASLHVHDDAEADTAS